MIEGPSECGRAETTISRLKMEFYHPLLDQMSNAEKALKKKMPRIEYSGDILTCLIFPPKTISCYTNNITFSAITTHR